MAVKFSRRELFVEFQSNPREVKKALQPTPHSGRSTPPQPDALPVMESAVKAIKKHFVQAKAAGSGWEGGSWVGWEGAGRCGGRRRRAVGVTGGRGLTLASLRVVADIDSGRAHKGR